MKPSPPAIFLRFLRWFCDPSLLPSIEGDLFELYYQRCNGRGSLRANVLFAIDVLLLLRPGIIKPLLRNRVAHKSIALNYIKTTARVMRKSKLHTAITLLGLSVGIFASLVVASFTLSELQINQHLKDVERLFIVKSNYKPGYQNFEWFVPAPLAQRAVELYPATFEGYYRLLDRNVNLSHGDKHLRIQSVIGDSTLLTLFGFEVLRGDAATALIEPGSIVISEKCALQLFGKADAVGESITLATERNGPRELEVKAVVSDPQKKNTVTDFMNMDAQVFLNFHIANDYFQDLGLHNWEVGTITYLKLHPGVAAHDAIQRLNALLRNEAPAAIGESRDISLHGLKNFYLNDNNASVERLLITLAVTAVFILLLSITNFINITIAGSMTRLKEMGVRKVIGSSRGDIILQLLTESVIVSFASGVLAISAYHLLIPFLSAMFNTTFAVVSDWPLATWAYYTLALITLGVVAGALPAVRLASLRPLDNIKGSFAVAHRSILSRTILVVQFSVTTFVLIAAVVLTEQLNFFVSADVGFERAGVLIIDAVPREFSAIGFQKAETAKEQLRNAAGTGNGTLSWGAPQYNFKAFDARVQVSGQPEAEGAMLSVGSADHDYADVFGLTLAAGRFLKETVASTYEIVLNQKAAQMLGVSVGDRVTVQGFEESAFSVVGILQDFHIESLHVPVKPLCIMNNYDFGAYRFLSFKVAQEDLHSTLRQLEQQWRKVYPLEPFEFQFADQRFAALYQTELQMKQSAAFAAALMLMIVLTGIIGLVGYTSARRCKEIGIRKVMGASPLQVLTLISTEYVRVIFLAFLIAPALAYYFAHTWLSQFAYRITISWWMFLLPMFLLLTFTVIVASAKALKAALVNPVNALRLP